jgi:hypothetical protein
MTLCQYNSTHPDLQVKVVSDTKILGFDLEVKDLGVGVEVRSTVNGYALYLDDALLDAIVAMVTKRNAEGR